MQNMNTNDGDATTTSMCESIVNAVTLRTSFLDAAHYKECNNVCIFLPWAPF